MKYLKVVLLEIAISSAIICTNVNATTKYYGEEESKIISDNFVKNNSNIIFGNLSNIYYDINKPIMNNGNNNSLNGYNNGKLKVKISNSITKLTNEEKIKNIIGNNFNASNFYKKDTDTVTQAQDLDTTTVAEYGSRTYLTDNTSELSTNCNNLSQSNKMSRNNNLFNSQFQNNCKPKQQSQNDKEEHINDSLISQDNSQKLWTPQPPVLQFNEKLLFNFPDNYLSSSSRKSTNTSPTQGKQDINNISGNENNIEEDSELQIFSSILKKHKRNIDKKRINSNEELNISVPNNKHKKKLNISVPLINGKQANKTSNKQVDNNNNNKRIDISKLFKTDINHVNNHYNKKNSNNYFDKAKLINGIKCNDKNINNENKYTENNKEISKKNEYAWSNELNNNKDIKKNTYTENSNKIDSQTNFTYNKNKIKIENIVAPQTSFIYDEEKKEVKNNIEYQTSFTYVENKRLVNNSINPQTSFAYDGEQSNEEIKRNPYYILDGLSNMYSPKIYQVKGNTNILNEANKLLISSISSAYSNTRFVKRRYMPEVINVNIDTKLANQYDWGTVTDVQEIGLVPHGQSSNFTLFIGDRGNCRKLKEFIESRKLQMNQYYNNLSKINSNIELKNFINTNKNVKVNYNKLLLTLNDYIKSKEINSKNINNKLPVNNSVVLDNFIKRNKSKIESKENIDLNELRNDLNIEKLKKEIKYDKLITFCNEIDNAIFGIDNNSMRIIKVSEYKYITQNQYNEYIKQLKSLLINDNNLSIYEKGVIQELFGNVIYPKLIETTEELDEKVWEHLKQADKLEKEKTGKKLDVKKLFKPDFVNLVGEKYPNQKHAIIAHTPDKAVTNYFTMIFEQNYSKE